jgi:hypothetical protein
MERKRKSFIFLKAGAMFLVVLICIGCQPVAREGVAQHEKSRLIFNSEPQKWEIGDSLFISAFFDNSDSMGRPNGFGYIAPGIIDSMTIREIENTLVMDLIWIPDSLQYRDQKQLRMTFEEGFDKAGESYLLEWSETVKILRDSAGYYFFQPDTNSYKIDTFFTD